MESPAGWRAGGRCVRLPGVTLALMFPGQGSQKVGMGTELLEARPELFDRYFGAADVVAGQSIRARALEGPPEALTATDVAQPALFTLSLAL